MTQDIEKRDELLAMAAAALTKSVPHRRYRGGGTGLLSDLLFAFGCPMTVSNIRNITARQRRQNPTVQAFEKSISVPKRRK